jgi:small subunit ribosomal protein S6
MARKDYETLFILKPDFTEEEVTAAIAKLTDYLTKQGGEIMEEERQGKRRLAYTIKKQRYGYYALLRFTIEPGKIEGLEKIFRFNEEYLKNIIVIYDTAAGRGLIPLSERPSDDDRRRPRDDDDDDDDRRHPRARQAADHDSDD